ncbi:MAG: hypothetical protein KC643_29515 [Nitrospira sp.]|nr:hypothetical protein [Nitrospira sp.]
MNSACRIAEILKVAKSQSPNLHVFKAWASTFNLLDPKDNWALQMEVLELITLLKSEWNLLRTQLYQIKGLPASLYEPVLMITKEVLGSAGNLNSTWEPFQKKITDDVLRQLEWCGHSLKENFQSEEPIPENELKELLNEVQELGENLGNSSLPFSVKMRVFHYVDLIKKAIMGYPIIGAVAFKNVVATSIGEVILNPNEIFPPELEEEKQIRERLKNLLKKSFSILERFPKWYSYLKIAEDLTSRAKILIENIGSMK